MHFAFFVARQIDECERCSDFLRCSSLVPLPLSVQSEADVLADVQMGKQGVVLKHHAEAALRGRHRRHILTRHRDAAAVRRLEAGQQAQHGRLAAPRRPEQRQNLSLGDVERDRTYGDAGAPTFLDRLNLEKPAHWPFPVPRTCWSHQRIQSGPCSARRFQSTSATTIRRRTSRTHSGSESAGRSSRAGNR